MRLTLAPLALLAPVFCFSCTGSPESAEPPAPAAPSATTTGPDGFQSTFAVDKSILAATGGNPYFSLRPGHVLTLKEDDVVLTVTALNETRVVDGVTTRVVEEREETPEGLLEVSRNFFAVDPTFGDVYYFGEEVDIYKDGKVASHGGAWLSGVNGARFGLFLPGHPAVGRKFYQEVAPGIAMDRAEVVSLDERVETPAGAFEHCLHIKETSPLERGSSHKWFAPGVGLVRDDDFVLIAHKP